MRGFVIGSVVGFFLPLVLGWWGFALTMVGLAIYLAINSHHRS